MTRSVRAALVTEHGPPDAVRVADVPAPGPVGPGEVRVAVAAAAVNFPDVLIVAGRYQVVVPPPFTPGSELAGAVAEVGAGVTGLAVGDRVFGAVLVGAFAEELVVPATSLTRTPDGVDDASAAAFGVAHRTAWHVLRTVAGLQPGEELVVLGAGGGVGLAAVQLGAQLGAVVTAVASSPEKLEAAAAQGATGLVDHRVGDLRAALRTAVAGGAHVVVDPVGGRWSEPALRSLRWGGRFVTVGYASGEIPRLPLNLVLLKGVQVLGFDFAGFARHRPEDLTAGERELLALLAAGAVRPHIGARFGLEEVAAALGHVAAGRAVGKVVVEVRPTTAAAG